MIRHEKNGIAWVEFELLAEIQGLTHGIFLRKGGVSKGSFDSLNLSFGVGDERAAVEENRKRVQEILQVPPFVFPQMCHGDAIAEVKEAVSPDFPCDGLMTNRGGIPFLVTHADCQVAIFYDPLKKAVANVHCGWRGNVANIYGKTIDKMQAQYGSKPEELLVCISPSLGPDHAQFIHYEKELPSTFLDYQVKPFYFNFWSISEAQLIEGGILPHHIEIARYCTYTNANDCFSYRKDKGCGRNAVVTFLK